MKIAFFIVLISLILLNNCKSTKEDAKNFLNSVYLKNNTTKNVKINLFTNDTLYKSLLINSFDSLLIDKYSSLYNKPFIVSLIDSSSILFDDNKKLIQTRFPKQNQDTINSLLEFYNYRKFRINNNSPFNVVYTLTQADYLRAK